MVQYPLISCAYSSNYYRDTCVARACSNLLFVMESELGVSGDYRDY